MVSPLFILPSLSDLSLRYRDYSFLGVQFVKYSVFVLTLIGRSDNPSTVNTTKWLETLCLHTNGLYNRSV